MSLLKYLTPTNLAEEKVKFFSSKTYNPQFKYACNDSDFASWISKNPNLQDFFQAVKSQDSSLIEVQAGKLFDTKLTKDFLLLANQIIAVKPETLAKESLDEVVASFNEAFKFFGLDNYKVEVADQRGFNFRPVPRHQKIIVSKYLILDFFSIDGEVKHELAHILRYENGKHNNIPVSKDYLPTEEGLAAYCQDYAGLNGRSSLFQHAAEYAVTQVGLEGSLRDVIEFLESVGFSKELAWQRAVRHKFGFVDTSQPGDIMKPSMYFYHEQIIKQLSADEKYRLFVGKISVNQLKLFTSYRGLIPLEKLKEFYRWGDLTVG